MAAGFVVSRHYSVTFAKNKATFLWAQQGNGFRWDIHGFVL
jgi:hypothetical protein